MELDFLYPSEGIHWRWDYGYRITATAATWDQAAFVLSVPRKPADATQETLRTSSFPSSHVKVNFILLYIFDFDFSLLVMFKMFMVPFVLQEQWGNNLYIASVCYGRTVS